MIKKTLFLVLFSFTVSLFMFASSQRLSSIAGNGNFVSYMVKDYWCDSMYVNPAYMADKNEEFSKFLLVNNSYFKYYMDLSQYNKDENTYNSATDYKNIQTTSSTDVGMIFPFNKFYFGFVADFYFNGNYYKSRQENNNIPGNKTTTLSEDKSFNSYMSGLFIFSWSITENVKFGFSFYSYSNMYNFSESETETIQTNPASDTTTTEKSKDQVSINENSKFGVLIKGENADVAISIPVNVGYKKNYSTTYYVESVDDWRYGIDMTSGAAGLSTVFDLNKGQKIYFRVPVNFNAYIYYEKTALENKSSFDGLTLNFDEYTYLNNGFTSSSGLTVNNDFSGKALFFYGIDGRVNDNFSIRKVSNNTNTDIGYKYNHADVDFGVGSFVGTELKFINKVTFRLGMKFSILDLFYYYNEQKYDTPSTTRIDSNSSNVNFYFLNNVSFNSGASFNCSDNFSIEVNSNCLYSYNDISNSKNKTFRTTHEDVEDKNNQYVNFEFSFGFVSKL
jgi:hypothetical protein